MSRPEDPRMERWEREGLVVQYEVKTEGACPDRGPGYEGVHGLGCGCCEFCGSWGDVHDIWCSDIDTETSQQETP